MFFQRMFMMFGVLKVAVVLNTNINISLMKTNQTNDICILRLILCTGSEKLTQTSLSKKESY